MKTAKRSLAVLLACMMMLGSFGLVGSAKFNTSTTSEPTNSAVGTVTYGLDIYKDGTLLADGALLSPGDVIDVQLKFGTDFYLGLLSTMVYYDSTYFEPALDGVAYTDSPANTFLEENSFIKMLTEDAPVAQTIKGEDVTLFDTITPAEKTGIAGYVNKAETGWKTWTPLAWREINPRTGKQAATMAILEEYAMYHYVGISFPCNAQSSTGGWEIQVPYAPYFSFQLRVKDGADSNGATTPIFVPMDGMKHETGETCNRLYATECPDGEYKTKGLVTLGQGLDLTNADIDFVIGEPEVHTHTYGEPVWSWSDDYKTATATFTCTDNDDTQTIDADIETTTVTAASCTVNQVVTYTATVEFGDESYSDAKENVEVPDSMIDHVWGDVEYLSDETHGITCTVCHAVKDGSVEAHDFSITVSEIPATEDAPGSRTVECAVCHIQKDEEIPQLAHTHEYGEPTWEWADDGSSATAIFTCIKDDDVQRIPADSIDEEITEEAECGKNEVAQYIATVKFGGETYESTLEGVEKTGTALEHSYGDPTWEWNEDNTAATATFVCTNCGDTQILNADVATETVSALGCESDYVVTRTATVNFNGKDYEDKKENITLETATGHTYGEPTWSWSEDCSTATATFTCEKGDDVVEVPAGQIDENIVTPLSCTDNKVVTYTAIVEFDGAVYTDTSKEVTAEYATGHAYDVVWNWADDYSSATATFTCSKCGDTQSVTDEAPVEFVETPAGCETPKTAHYEATVEFDGSIVKDSTPIITVEGSELDHDWPDTWEYVDETSHKQTCTRGDMDRTEPHNYVKNDAESTPATTTSEGENVFYCSGCGDRKTEVVPKLDHEHVAGEATEENRVEATCSKEGSYDEVVYCSVCGEELSRETKTVDKIPHTPADAVKENEVAATCSKEGS